MKKTICMAMALIVVLSLFAGCSENAKPQGNSPSAPATSQNTNSGETSNEPAETDNSEKEPDTIKSGAIDYEADELLQSYCDYVHDQGKDFEAVFNSMDDLVTRMDLGLAVLERDHLAFTPMYDEYNGSGKTIMGTPVTKTSTGDETTWAIEKVTENDIGSGIKKGDIEKTFISLNTKTNTLYTEQIRMRGSEMISKEVNRVVVLDDETVLSEIYSVEPDGRGDATISRASIFTYNAAKQDFEMVHGEFSDVVMDFTAPECLTNGSADKSTFLTFANETGTVKVAGGTGEIILP